MSRCGARSTSARRYSATSRRAGVPRATIVAIFELLQWFYRIVCGLPGVAHLVPHDRLAVGRDGHREMHGARVLALILVGRFDDLVRRPAVQHLAHEHVDGLGLVVANLDLDRLLHALG